MDALMIDGLLTWLHKMKTKESRWRMDADTEFEIAWRDGRIAMLNVVITEIETHRNR